MTRPIARAAAILCLGLVGSACIVDARDFAVYATNQTDMVVVIYEVSSTSGEETIDSEEVLPGAEWATRYGGNDCLRRVYRARNLDGDLIEERDTICRSDPWRIDGVPDQ